MSSLSSSSTNAEIEAAYLDNASYEEDASVTKAQAFITACRCILLKRPQRSAFKGAGTEAWWDVSLIQEQLTRAQNWLAAQGGSGGSSGSGVPVDPVVHPSLENFR